MPWPGPHGAVPFSFSPATARDAEVLRDAVEVFGVMLGASGIAWFFFRRPSRPSSQVFPRGLDANVLTTAGLTGVL